MKLCATEENEKSNKFKPVKYKRQSKYRVGEQLSKAQKPLLNSFPKATESGNMQRYVKKEASWNNNVVAEIINE